MSRVLVAAGASGGHVYPALATAIELRDRGHDVVFAGGDRLEARVIPEAGFQFHPLGAKRPPSVRAELLTPKGIAAMATIGWATLRARRLIARTKPDVVLGMGGFAGVPVTLAATRTRALPVILHEQNAHLSFAQRIPLKRANVLACGLPIEEHVAHDRIVVTGNPVRRAIAALADDASGAQRDARVRLGLDPDAPTLLVAGGSLGSGPLNDTVPTISLPPGVQVLHLAGAGRDAPVRDAWSRSGTRTVVVEFCETMEDAYRAADVAVCRSGAITVAELAIAGLPSILVPLLTLQRGDQAANARVLERAGGALVVAQDDPSFVDALSTALGSLLADGDRRSAMRAGARSVARPDAAERLADEVERLI